MALTKFNREQDQGWFLFQVDWNCLGYLLTWKSCPTDHGIEGR